MKKTLIIDFLYLDLSCCQRCQGTELALMQALDQSADQLRLEGYEIALNKVNITSETLAIAHRFISSPTIRVNGVDIADDLQENTCEDCGDLCGTSVECRVWTYKGQTSTTPPVAMIKEALLKHAEDDRPIDEQPYLLPDNLKRYFDGLMKKTENYPTITLKHL